MELLSAPGRFIGGEEKSIYRKLMKIKTGKTDEIQNTSKNELNQAE